MGTVRTVSGEPVIPTLGSTLMRTPVSVTYIEIVVTAHATAPAAPSTTTYRRRRAHRG